MKKVLDIPFSFGQNNSVPAVVNEPGFFVSLQNASPEGSVVECLSKRLLTHAVNDKVSAIEYTYDPTSRFADVFAFGESKVSRLDAGSTFLDLYTTALPSTDRWAVVQWRNDIFFTRLDTPLRKIAGNASSNVPVVLGVDAESNKVELRLSARYAIAAHDHLWLGHVLQNNTLRSTSVRWSDLYNPETWEISESSESDEFQLSVNDLEITGLLTHRNQVLIFTINSIWIARYEGLPTVYSFEPLYAKVGCGYHYSAIGVEEDIYFISQNGVYKMNSFQISSIGDPIWDLLKTDLALAKEAPAIADEKRKLIYWAVGGKTYVYNYAEKRWAVYNFTYCTAFKYLPGLLYRTSTIDSVSGLINSYSVTIDSGINTAAISQTQFTGFSTGVYQEESGTVQNHTVVLETPYFYSDSLWTEKELDRIRLVHEKTGNPVITCTINMKDSFDGPVRSESVTILTEAAFASESIFQAQRVKVGKLLSLRFSYNNTATDYVNRIIGISVEGYHGGAKK